AGNLITGVVMSGMMKVTVEDQGLLQGIAHDLLRERSELKGENIKILADVNVKHSAALGELSLEDEVADLIERAGADAVIVSGPGTGKIAAVEELATVKAAAGDAPVLVGSGVSLQSIDAYLSLADGFIIGSYFKVDGKVRNPVDPARVRGLMERLR
ncbi:MAG: BtpA/SgcQ family protein, partial [Acidobacteriota bacterium]